MKSFFSRIVLGGFIFASCNSANAYSLQTQASGLKDRGAIEYYTLLSPIWSWPDNKLTYKIDASNLTALPSPFSYSEAQISDLKTAIMEQFRKWQHWGDFTFAPAASEDSPKVLLKFFDNRGEDKLVTNGILDTGEDLNLNMKLDIGPVSNTNNLMTGFSQVNLESLFYPNGGAGQPPKKFTTSVYLGNP